MSKSKLEYHNDGGNAIAVTTRFPVVRMGKPGQRVVRGRFDRPRGTTATLRALDGAELYDAELTFRQAKRKSGASYGYLHTAIGLSAEERDLVRRGVRTLRASTSRGSATGPSIALFARWASIACGRGSTA